MTRISARRKIKPAKPLATLFRYRDEDHFDAVRQAAAAAGIKINTWLIDVTTAAAQKQLAKLK